MQKECQDDLPAKPIPKLRKDNNYDKNSVIEQQQLSSHTLFGVKGSDLVEDYYYCKSVVDVFIKFTGAAVLYKARLKIR